MGCADLARGMETPTIRLARATALAYFEYRTALADQLKSIPDPSEARQIAHALAVQLATGVALRDCE